MDEAAVVNFHQLYCSVQGIGHVHHVHECAGCDGACELLAAYCAVVDVACVVGGAATGRRLVGDKTREAYRARVGAVLAVVVVGEELRCHLRNTVDGAGTLDCVLRSTIGGRFGAEATDAAGREYHAAVLACHFEHLNEAVDTDVPCHERLAFGNYGV